MSKEPFTKEDIAKKAHEIWLHRQANGIDGSSEDDWEEAVNYYKKRKDLIWKWRLMKNLKLVSIPFKSTLHFFWKTLPTSDWMKLLAVPLILSFAGSVITSQIQQENRQNETVNKYFEQMEKLFANDKLDLSEADNPLRILIKSRSNAVLRSVDLKRKEVIIGFLAEAGLLINDKEKEIEGISLSFRDFTENNFDITKANNGFRRSVGINLNGSNLEKGNFDSSNLSNANLVGAQIYHANLPGAKLEDADLTNANLYRARLYDANLEDAKLDGVVQDANLEDFKIYLRYANLKGAKIRNANLQNANLFNTILYGAKLEGANLEEADLADSNLTNQQIKSACNWEKAYFAKYWNSKQKKLILDKDRQKAKIKELKEDKTSNPTEKPDCDKWKD